MNIKLRKKLLAIITSSFLTLIPTNANCRCIIKNTNVKAAETVNMRINNTLSSLKIGIFKVNDTAYCILKDEDWYLIKYNNLIGYVNDNYVDSYSELNSSIKHYYLCDLGYADDFVNLRDYPSTDGRIIQVISKLSEIEIMAITENSWYLAKYNNRIGYVKTDYITSLINQVNELYPKYKIDTIKEPPIVYAINNVNIRSSCDINSPKIGQLKKYESAKVILEDNSWYLIKSEDYLGFVMKDYVDYLKDTYIIVDISMQKLFLYNNNDLLLSTDITTGKKSTPTNYGLFQIYAKRMNRYLKGDGYESFVKYWMPFDGGIGLHDASWRKKFGGNIYVKNGSHGCVNLPLDITDNIYESVSVGTKVLVHK